jgi:hypothetical protein
MKKAVLFLTATFFMFLLAFIIFSVHPVSAAMKPCLVTFTGETYIYDGTAASMDNSGALSALIDFYSMISWGPGYISAGLLNCEPGKEVQYIKWLDENVITGHFEGKDDSQVYAMIVPPLDMKDEPYLTQNYYLDAVASDPTESFSLLCNPPKCSECGVYCSKEECQSLNWGQCIYVPNPYSSSDCIDCPDSCSSANCNSKDKCNQCSKCRGLDCVPNGQRNGGFTSCTPCIEGGSCASYTTIYACESATNCGLKCVWDHDIDHPTGFCR